MLDEQRWIGHVICSSLTVLIEEVEAVVHREDDRMNN